MLKYLKKCVLNENKDKQILLALLQFSFSDIDLWKRREIHNTFYSSLITVVGGETEALMWVKKHISPDICKTLLLDVDHSDTTLQKLVDRVSYAKSKISEHLEVHFLKLWPTAFVSVVVTYQDLLKDLATVTFLLTILELLPFTRPAELYSQIFWLLLISLALPLVSSSLHTALCYPYIILDPSYQFISASLAWWGSSFGLSELS